MTDSTNEKSSKAAPARDPAREEGGRRLREIFARLSKEKYPPVHLWEPDFCGDIDIRIARDGQWYYMGTPIARPEIVRLFASVLRHDDDGYYLVTPVEKLRITVEDAPYLAVRVEDVGSRDEPALLFHTQTDEPVLADADHPLFLRHDPETGEDRPYLLVRDRLEALIARPVYYELVDRLFTRRIDGVAMLGLKSRGVFFPFAPAEDETPSCEAS